MTSRVNDDLAYVREVAEAGVSAPLLGGRFLVWWGLLATAAYIGHYLIIAGIAGVPLSALGILWSSFIVLGLGGYFMLVRTFPEDKPGRSSAGNRVSATAWSAAGFVLGAFFLGLTIKSFMIGSASIGFTWSIPVVLGVYGIAQLVSGVTANVRWLTLAGYAAIGFVGLTVLIVDRAELYLVAALAAALTVLLPGILMMRDEPSTTV